MKKIDYSNVRDFLRRIDPGMRGKSELGLIMLILAAMDQELSSFALRSGCMIDWAQDIDNFHQKFGIQYEGPPRLMDQKLHDFRMARLREELAELQDAINEKNLVGVLDAYIDEIYIALGNMHLHGFTPATINEAWRRVHEKNMLKELAHGRNPGKHGHKSDIVKPAGWTPPDLSDLIKA
jgi:predicted HAD superfamily Cof-like phosphohydrolase